MHYYAICKTYLDMFLFFFFKKQQKALRTKNLRFSEIWHKNLYLLCSRELQKFRLICIFLKLKKDKINFIDPSVDTMHERVHFHFSHFSVK